MPIYGTIMKVTDAGNGIAMPEDKEYNVAVLNNIESKGLKLGDRVGWWVRDGSKKMANARNFHLSTDPQYNTPKLEVVLQDTSTQDTLIVGRWNTWKTVVDPHNTEMERGELFRRQYILLLPKPGSSMKLIAQGRYISDEFPQADRGGSVLRWPHLPQNDHDRIALDEVLGQYLK